MIDKHKRLEDNPFRFMKTKSGLVQIFYENRVVTQLSGKQAQQFSNKITGLSQFDQQLVMAKTTGNFKRGNEKQ